MIWYTLGDDSTLSEQFDDRSQAFADFNFKTGAVVHKLTAGAQYQPSQHERLTNSAAAIPYIRSCPHRCRRKPP